MNAMISLGKLQKKLHLFFLKRKLGSTTHRNGAIRFQEPNSVIILYNATNPLQRELVDRFASKLKAGNKKVQLLGYLNHSKYDKYKDIHSDDLITPKDLNWMLNPKPEIVNKYIQTDYDLLIDLHTEECMPLEYIAAFSKAKFRVGRYFTDKTYCYDLMIHLSEKGDLMELIEQIKHYLNQIKINAG